MKLSWLICISVSTATLSACAEAQSEPTSQEDSRVQENVAIVTTPAEPKPIQPPDELFNPLLNTQFQSAFPVGSFIKEEWVKGLLACELRDSSVVSPGNGIVTWSEGSHVKIEFPLVDNGMAYPVHFSIHRLTSDLSVGDTVSTGQLIGHSDLWQDDHFVVAVEMWSKAPSIGFKMSPHKPTRNTFKLPGDIDNLIVIRKSDYGFWHYQNGELAHHFSIALGQDPEGHKVEQGDNRTPEGEYRIVEKRKGPFYSETAAFLGDSWFRINYPNAHDAEVGYENGLITAAQRDAIKRAWKAGRDTPNNTALGGHIGIHGWIDDWKDYSTKDITWGCVSMRNTQIDEIYDEIPVGTTVIILP